MELLSAESTKAVLLKGRTNAFLYTIFIEFRNDPIEIKSNNINGQWMKYTFYRMILGKFIAIT